MIGFCRDALKSMNASDMGASYLIDFEINHGHNERWNYKMEYGYHNGVSRWDGKVTNINVDGLGAV